MLHIICFLTTQHRKHHISNSQNKKKKREKEKKCVGTLGRRKKEKALAMYHWKTLVPVKLHNREEDEIREVDNFFIPGRFSFLFDPKIAFPVQLWLRCMSLEKPYGFTEDPNPLWVPTTIKMAYSGDKCEDTGTRRLRIVKGKPEEYESEFKSEFLKRTMFLPAVPTLPWNKLNSESRTWVVVAWDVERGDVLAFTGFVNGSPIDFNAQGQMESGVYKKWAKACQNRMIIRGANLTLKASHNQVEWPRPVDVLGSVDYNTWTLDSGINLDLALSLFDLIQQKGKKRRMFFDQNLLLSPAVVPHDMTDWCIDELQIAYEYEMKYLSNILGLIFSLLEGPVEELKADFGITAARVRGKILGLAVGTVVVPEKNAEYKGKVSYGATLDYVSILKDYHGLGLCYHLVRRLFADVLSAEIQRSQACSGMKLLVNNVGGQPGHKCYTKAAQSLGYRFICKDKEPTPGNCQDIEFQPSLESCIFTFGEPKS